MGTSAKKQLNRFWPLLLITGVWLLFAFPYLFKGYIPFPSDYLVSFFPPWNTEYGMPVKNNAMPDVITQIFPWKKLTIDTWKSGALPLWNPYSFSGTSHAANYQSAVFSPINALFLIFPFLSAWTLMVILQPLWGGLGTYLFLRSIGKSQISSFIGSCSFMFCSFMTTWMAYGTLGWAVSFLPWILLGIEEGMIRRFRWYPLVIAFGVAVSFLSGHFQISLYVLGTVITYALYRRHWRAFWFIGLGMLMALPQLVLTFDAYFASTRNVSIGKIEVIPWQYFVTIIIPDFFGNPVTRNDWFGHYAEWGMYAGVIPFFLALLSILNVREGRRIFFFGLAIFVLLFAFPTVFNDLLYRLQLPVLSTSASSRIMVIFSFSVSVLAAYGLDDLQRLWKSTNGKRIGLFTACILLAFAGIWIYMFQAKGLSPEKIEIAKRNSILPSMFGLGLIVASTIGFMRSRMAKVIAMCILVSLVGFDSLRFATKWMPLGKKEYMYPAVSSTIFLQNTIGQGRVFGNIGNEMSGIFSIPIVEGYDAMYQGRYGEFIQAASTGQIHSSGRSVVQFDKHGKYRTEVLKLLGIKYIYHRTSDGRNSWTFPYWEYQEKGAIKLIFNDEKYHIFEYTDAYPRAFLASSYKVTTDDWDIIRTVFDPETNTREMLVLEHEPLEKPEIGTGNASITSYEPNRVKISTQSEVSKLLFLSDVYDPGWHATVDGIEVPVYRADYAFRAISVPKGSHDIEFYYFPRKLTYAFLLSLGAFILLVYEYRHIRSIS